MMMLYTLRNALLEEVGISREDGDDEHGCMCLFAWHMMMLIKIVMSA